MKEQDRVKTEIKELLSAREWAKTRELLRDIPAPDIADLLPDMDKTDRMFLFSLLPRQLAGEAFSYLESRRKDDLLKELTDEETRHLLAGLSPDDRAEFFEELPGLATQRLLNLLNPRDRRQTLQLLGFPQESVGRLMTPDYVAVQAEWSIDHALRHIRRKGKDSEAINVIYVVDPSWKLIDALELRKFVLAPMEQAVEQIMDHNFTCIKALEDREEAVRMIQHYDLVALPVVDSEGVLLGTVTVDDVLDVAEEEATEDFHRVAAVAPLKMSYRESGFWSLYRKRIGWLAALIVVNMASGHVIARHEDLLLSSIALSFFIPLLIATGGNAGAQSATLMVRAIATGDLRADQWLWAVGKELLVGLGLGVTLGLATWFLGFYRGGFDMAVIVFLTMTAIVLVSNLIGVGMPFLLDRLKMDPAVASSPLITTVVDLVGLTIYFSIAVQIL